MAVFCSVSALLSRAAVASASLTTNTWLWFSCVRYLRWACCRFLAQLLYATLRFSSTFLCITLTVHDLEDSLYALGRPEPDSVVSFLFLALPSKRCRQNLI